MGRLDGIYNFGKGKGLSQDAIDREVQRRLTQRLAAAGIPQGEIALEILFMLPPDFVRAYARLFHASLDTALTGGAGKGGGDGQVKRVPAKLRGTAGSAHATDSGGGRKYRTYWSVKDEEKLKAKGSIDRKLGRLARACWEASQGDGARAAKLDLPCPRCETDLAVLAEVGTPMRYCPSCGVALRAAAHESPAVSES